jgi:hypothetical protein
MKEKYGLVWHRNSQYYFTDYKKTKKGYIVYLRTLGRNKKLNVSKESIIRFPVKGENNGRAND